MSTLERIGLAALQDWAPTRRWQLILVNRALDMRSLEAAKAEAVPLMYPATTVMDFTISYALRSAAEGLGAIWGCGEGSVRSGARVVLSGLGADEQCVGYKGRHRTRFAKGGWDALAREIERDVGRHLTQQNGQPIGQPASWLASWSAD